MLVTILAVLLVDHLLGPDPSAGRKGGRDQISAGGDNSGGGRAFGVNGLSGVKVAVQDDGNGHCCRHHLLPPLRRPAASRPSAAAALRLNFCLNFRLHIMVGIPLPAGVVELGSTDLIFQSSDLTSTVLPTCRRRPHQLVDIVASADPLAASAMTLFASSSATESSRAAMPVGNPASMQ